MDFFNIDRKIFFVNQDIILNIKIKYLRVLKPYVLTNSPLKIKYLRILKPFVLTNSPLLKKVWYMIC